VVLLATVGACASQVKHNDLFEVVPDARWPLLHDDLDLDSILEATDRSLDYYRTVPGDTVFTFGSEQRTASQLESGIRRFREILSETEGADARRDRLRREFILLQSVGRNGRGNVLYTGYFEPLVEARRKLEPPFQYPVYAVPDDLVEVDLGDFGIDLGPKRLVGRVEGDTLVPYADRETIDYDPDYVVPAHVLGYLADPLDVFFLQVQGSGTLIFADGTRLRAGYAIGNGHRYRSIGRLLIDDGLVSRGEMSMQAIRTYLESNPDDLRRVLAYNRSYVFFRPLPAEGGPLGCYGVPLTAGRSIATDRRLVPAPVVAWITGAMPDGASGERKFERFAFNQDTGGSIVGPGRVDLFIGAGDAAAEIAGRMQHGGRLYLLLPSSI
jgi:membrane-bound lytic murein transglycosylase A